MLHRLTVNKIIRLVWSGFAV